MKFWFTWGSGQEHPNCYTIIDAADITEARSVMFARAGHDWSMMYNSAEACGVEKYHLRYVPIDDVRLPSDSEFAQMLNELLDLESGLTERTIDELDSAYTYWKQFNEFTWTQRAFIRTEHEQHID